MTGRRTALEQAYHPSYVVWELTLRCDQPCSHCGSRAGAARPTELNTQQALDVVAQLREARTREVVLIGGEAYLHDGFLEIVTALRDAGIRPTMTTGGRGVTQELAARMQQAGLASVSVSVDGLAPSHDRIRGVAGSFERALAALGHLRAAGITVAANTNLNRANQADLEALYEVLRPLGIVSWQVQLTVPLGRAADRPALLLQPWELLDVVPRVAALKARAFDDGVLVMPGNNLGYFGPEEALLRSVTRGGRDHFAGCQAGRFVLGIEADGAVKGCPSLQTASYVGGSLVKDRLQTIWDEAPELAFTRARTIEALWGFCLSCPFAPTCLGGCTFTSHALFGRPGNNPYCHYRARTLAARGQRERLVPTTPAQGRPFDHGLFELVLEAADVDDPTARLPVERLVQLGRRPVG